MRREHSHTECEKTKNHCTLTLLTDNCKDNWIIVRLGLTASNAHTTSEACENITLSHPLVKIGRLTVIYNLGSNKPSLDCVNLSLVKWQRWLQSWCQRYIELLMMYIHKNHIRGWNLLQCKEHKDTQMETEKNESVDESRWRITIFLIRISRKWSILQHIIDVEKTNLSALTICMWVHGEPIPKFNLT